MFLRFLRVLCGGELSGAGSVLVGWLLLSAVACSQSAPAPIHITLDAVSGGSRPAIITVTGLSSWELDDVQRAHLNEAEWEALLRVTVGDQNGDSVPAVKGHYAITSNALTFSPIFPFDAGRAYRAAFDPSRLPHPRHEPVATSTLSLPATAASARTTVTGVHPSAPVVPENLLRLYIDFSAPMGSAGAADFVHLVDRTDGKDEVVEGAFLPVEANFWNPDHTRYTLFLDPGRVKQDILPNRQRGRPLKAGRKYALVIDAAWTDANRQPLASPFRHEFTAAPAVTSAIRIREWKLGSVVVGSRDTLEVTFPRAVDHAVIMRALGIERADGPVQGSAVISADDLHWRFTPAEPWAGGDYAVRALAFLEDPQGNQIDRPFEEAVDAPTPEKTPEVYRLPFSLGVP